MKFIDLTGRRFGKLTALCPIKNHNRNNRHYFWRCKCECGTEKPILGAHLRSGHTQSCGCSWYQCGEKHKSWRGYKEISMRFYKSMKSNAAVRKLTFDVTIEELWDLFLQQNKKCALSGLPIVFGANHGRIKGTASLDRIDSTKGYTANNIQWVHVDVNHMKWNMLQVHFLDMCRIINNYQQNNVSLQAIP